MEKKIYEEIKQIKDMVCQLITIVGATNARIEGVEEELQGVKNEVQEVKEELKEVKNEVQEVKEELKEVKNEVQEVKEELKTKVGTNDLANLANGIDDKFNDLNENLHQQNEFFLEKFAKHEQEIFMLKKRLVG